VVTYHLPSIRHDVTPPTAALSPEQLKQEGLALFNQGAYDDALGRFEAAATAFEGAGEAAGRAEMLNNIGVVHRLRGNWQAAAEALTQAERVFAEAGDKNRQGQALSNLGDLYASQGERDQAARCYSDAAALFAQAQDGEKQSMVLRALSLLRLRQRRFFEAISYMEQSVRAHPRPSLGQRLLRLLIRFMFRAQGGG
jgi:eukaryotic-like serine/threonine-protein kinase